MQRKINEFTQAILLRKQGKSIRYIAKALHISSSTASLWCKNIELSTKQRKLLQINRVNIAHLRSLAKKKHENKLLKIQNLLAEGKREIPKLNKREYFLTGLALYWAEGFKNSSEGRVGFCNSDPNMILFICKWFKEILDINPSNFVLRVEINVSHKDRLSEIEAYWSKLIGISTNQFNKPFLKQTLWKRNYKNRKAYFGVLRIQIRRSSDLLYKIKGMMQGLSAR